MRALVGALLGLAAGAAVVGALDVVQGGKAYWSVLIAGLLAGLLMRGVAGGGGSPYAKGALAAIATALAAIGGPIAATQWFASMSSASTLDNVAVSTPADDAADDADASTEAAEPLPEVVPTEATAPLSTVAIKRPVANTSSAKDLVCLIIGCLLAYQMGKGSQAKPAAEDADPEAPADPGDDAGEGDSEEG